MRIAIRIADLFAGRADGEEPPEAVFCFKQHLDLDADADQDENRPGEKDDSDEKIAKMGNPVDEGKGHREIGQEEKNHHAPVHTQGAHDFLLAVLGQKWGENEQFSGLKYAEKHDQCADYDHGYAENVLRHGVRLSSSKNPAMALR